MRKEEVDGVVVDLRNNGGGSLYEAKQLTGLFLPAGPVVQVRDHDGKVDRQYAGSRRALWEGPLVVLVNRLSASASEIFAGAIQDYGRGLIVGTPTFGKGTVQNLAPLEDGQIKLTQATFYRVSGASTQERGVVPDIRFPSEYDLTEIGESALDNPLPWDMIAPVPGFRMNSTLSRQVDALSTRHEARSSEDPEFQYYADLIEYRNDVREETRISLQEQTRKLEREEDEARRLAIENRRRVGLGKETVASFDELDAEREAERLAEASPAEGSEGADSAGTEGDDDKPELVPDAYAKEAAEILVDSVRAEPVRKTVQR